MSRSLNDIETELLVLRCQDGGADALADIVRGWHPRLTALARRLTGDAEASADLVQEAWLAIVRGLHSLDDPARFKPWAYRIVSNKCADWVRSRQRERASHEAPRDPPRDDPAEPDEVRRLRVALSRLPGDQRAILSLFYVEQMSVRAIADVFGVPEGTVKSRMHHARNELRRTIEGVTP